MDWLPLIIAAIVGIIIGVIFTVIPYRRRVDELQYRLTDTQGKLKKSDTDLTEARGQAQSLTAGLQTTEAALADTKGQVVALTDERTALAASVAALSDEKSDLAASVAEAKNRIAALNDEKAALTDERAALEVALAGMTAQAASLRSQYDEANTHIASLTTDLKGHAAQIATLKTNAEATSEALSGKEAELAGAHEEIAKLKTDVDGLATVKVELEHKLVRTRADVAAELALLTSTIIKMKEEALNEAHARIVTLTNEVEALKSKDGAS